MSFSKPERMTLVQRAFRPIRVDELVVDLLLHVVHDTAQVVVGVHELPKSRGVRVHEVGIPVAKGGNNILCYQRDNPLLISLARQPPSRFPGHARGLWTSPSGSAFSDSLDGAA